MKLLIFGAGSDMTPAITRLYSATLIPKSACDVTNPKEVEEVYKRHKPDTVINLAGVSNPQSLMSSSHFLFAEEVAVNLMGPYTIASLGVRYKVEKFIFIGSVAGLYGKPNHAGYSASKAGVISLVQSMAMEGYDAYCISPGRVNTRMREKDYPGEDPATRLKVDDIGRVVKEVLDGKHQPGDNIIIRKRGTRTLRRVDKGEPWKDWLNVR